MAGIRSFFIPAFETGPDPDPGCLLTNTAVEPFTVPRAADGVRRELGPATASVSTALHRDGRLADIDGFFLPAQAHPAASPRLRPADQPAPPREVTVHRYFSRVGLRPALPG
ncbi:hypothetical protein ACFPFX_11570 [Streptomyces mauvecolor]|uniref:Uncharacterized protein n=1 Tax=Streptomyces mauvecolor TaxID=58345 RepID=A0ABV9UK83_9ACTN